MLPADRTEMVRTLVGLSTIKPGSKLTPEGLDVWWMAMQHWALDEFKQAAAHLARTAEFMPSPFHFEQLRKAGRPTAGEAFAVAVSHAASGNWRTGGCGRPDVDRAVQAIGGYVQIAMSDEDKLHFLERRFADHYEAMTDAEDTREAVPLIAGSTWKAKITGPRAVAGLLQKFRDQPEGAA